MIYYFTLFRGKEISQEDSGILAKYEQVSGQMINKNNFFTTCMKKHLWWLVRNLENGQK